MKYSIKLTRLEEIFFNFVDSTYGLTFRYKDKDLRTKDGYEFGYVINGVFYYFDVYSDGDKNTLEGFFGNMTEKLLLKYLNVRFPDANISKVDSTSY